MTATLNGMGKNETVAELVHEDRRRREAPRAARQSRLAPVSSSPCTRWPGVGVMVLPVRLPDRPLGIRARDAPALYVEAKGLGKNVEDKQFIRLEASAYQASRLLQSDRPRSFVSGPSGALVWRDHAFEDLGPSGHPFGSR